MSETKVQRRRQAGTGSTAPVSTIDFAALGKLVDITIYGEGGGPLYKIMQPIGTIRPVNSVDDAFEGFAAASKGLEANQCGFSYSATYDAFSMTMKTPTGGLVYASVQHDKEGDPLELPEYNLAVVEVTRDFKVDDQVILKKGQTMLKALSPDYVGAK